MIWGGAFTEQFLVGALPDTSDRNTILELLGNASIKGFLSARPQGTSSLDVLEFYNNSKVIIVKSDDDTELVSIKTKVQGKRFF